MLTKTKKGLLVLSDMLFFFLQKQTITATCGLQEIRLSNIVLESES